MTKYKPCETFLELEAPTSAELHELDDLGYRLELAIVHIEGQYCYRITIYEAEDE